MKKAKTIFAVSFLLPFILVFSFGINLNKMVCLSSGRVSASFFSLDDCCSSNKDNQQTSFSSKCCDFSSQYLKIDIAPQQFQAFSNVFFALPFTSVNGDFPVLVKKSVSASFAGFDLPPPRSGRFILTAKQSFLI